MAQKTRVTIMQYHIAESNKGGVLRSDLEEYFKCIPLVDVQQLTKLLDFDIQIWTDTLKKAQEAT